MQWLQVTDEHCYSRNTVMMTEILRLQHYNIFDGLFFTQSSSRRLRSFSTDTLMVKKILRMRFYFQLLIHFT